MEEFMNRKQFQEFLSQFPEDALICVETDDDFKTEGITYATLVECRYFNKDRQILFIGTSTRDREDGTGYYHKKYNFKQLKIIRSVSIYDVNR